jgi:hypothetical protein
MMVTYADGDRLFVTLQPDHSRVAGFLAAHWGNECFSRPHPWNSVVLAAQEHDRNWWRWECRPTLSDQNGPLDYQNDTLHHLGALRTRIYAAAVEDLIPIDPYAALLVLEHLTGLLTAGNGAFSFRTDVSDHPIASAYLAEQAVVKQGLLERLRQSPEPQGYCGPKEIEANCQVVEVCDALAQFLCNRYPLDSHHRGKDPNRVFREMPVPLQAAQSETRLEVRALDERRLAIAPYPFDRDHLEVNYVARWLSARPFASEQEFLEAFYGAETLAVQYSLEAA